MRRGHADDEPTPSSTDRHPPEGRGPVPEVSHPLLARVYDTLLTPVERAGVRRQRRRLLEGVAGRVVEIAAGTGLNVPLYPDTTEEVHAVDPDRHMLARLSRRASGSKIPIHAYRADARTLPFADEVFDAAIVAFALCTIPEPARTLEELHRVVRPGGLLRFLEHVRSPNVHVARFQDRINPLWGRVSGGCRLNQPTAEILESSRWRVDRLWRSGAGLVVAGQAFRT